jgi:hypothetical protein
MISCPRCNKVILLNLAFSKTTHSCTKVIQCPNEKCKAIYKIDMVEMEMVEKVAQ